MKLAQIKPPFLFCIFFLFSSCVLQNTTSQDIGGLLLSKGVNIIQQGYRIRLIIPVDRFFEPNSTKINRRYFSKFALIADYLKQYKGRLIVISAHTDNVKSEHVNRGESLELARNVAAFLWSRGISHKRMQVFGLADKKPIAGNETPYGSAYNRRVEILLPDCH